MMHILVLHVCSHSPSSRKGVVHIHTSDSTPRSTNDFALLKCVQRVPTELVKRGGCGEVEVGLFSQE